MSGGKSALNFAPYSIEKYRAEPMLQLYGAVYGTPEPMRRRWRWEFLQRPDAADLKIFGAWHGSDLVAVTVRIPCPLVIGSQTRSAFFAAHSMVHPSVRGRGVMKELYALAARSGGLQLSKGTAPAMYRRLMEMGYLPIQPSTYQVCLLAPVKWGVRKLFQTGNFELQESFKELELGEFFRVSRFSSQEVVFSEAWCGVTGGVVKDIAFLNWRYLDVPHHRYHVFIRICAGATCSFVVLRFIGLTAYLVDLRRSDSAADEPEVSVAFAKRYASRAGILKIVAWCTSTTLRQTLRRRLFLETSETPRFSYRPPKGESEAIDWSDLHFVHGDGDMEYL